MGCCSSSEKRQHRIRVMTFLSVAYAANCGGTGSLTGTGSNIVFKGNLKDFGEEMPITFLSWMMYAVPGMLTSVVSESGPSSCSQVCGSRTLPGHLKLCCRMLKYRVAHKFQGANINDISIEKTCVKQFSVFPHGSTKMSA